MSYCTNCGGEVKPEMLYCPKCGRRLITPTPSAKDDKPSDSATEQKVNKQEATAGSEIRKSKIYKEWVKYAGLSADEVPQKREARGAKHTNLLFYILVGVGISVCIGLLILLVRSW